VAWCCKAHKTKASVKIRMLASVALVLYSCIPAGIIIRMTMKYYATAMSYPRHTATLLHFSGLNLCPGVACKLLLHPLMHFAGLHSCPRIARKLLCCQCLSRKKPLQLCFEPKLFSIRGSFAMLIQDKSCGLHCHQYPSPHGATVSQCLGLFAVW